MVIENIILTILLFREIQHQNYLFFPYIFTWLYFVICCEYTLLIFSWFYDLLGGV